ncbi:UNVERIFIED_CONTAM: hypothetical protein FKN15_000656 [Acipenser sinensis]
MTTAEDARKLRDWILENAGLEAHSIPRAIQSLWMMDRERWEAYGREHTLTTWEEGVELVLSYLEAAISGTAAQVAGPPAEGECLLSPSPLQRSAKAREALQQLVKMWPQRPFQPKRPQEHQWRRTPPQHQPRPGGTKTSLASMAARGQFPIGRSQRTGWRPRGGGRQHPHGSSQAPHGRAQPKQP